VGFFFMSQVDENTSTLDLCWRVCLVGAGMGPMLSSANLAVQNALPRHVLGMATAATQLFRQIGGTVGVALFGAVLTHNISLAMSQQPHALGAKAKIDLSVLQQLAHPLTTQKGSDQVSSATAPIDVGSHKIVSRSIAAAFEVELALTAIALCLVTLVPSLKLEGPSARSADASNSARTA
jgi:hypothetical protein